MPTQSTNVNNFFNVPGMWEDVIANRPAPSLTNRIFLATDEKKWYRDTGTAWELWFSAGGAGVTSVGLALPGSVFNVTGSPVTGTGTLTGTFINQAINLVFASPASGAAGAPAFRALVAADLPALSGTYFKQNGNSFGATAVLGTADNNILSFITNNINRGQALTNGKLLWATGSDPGTGFNYSFAGGDMLLNGVRVGRGAGTGNNTVIGVNNALQANTTGSGNVAIGSFALAANTTGATNIAIGNNALLLNTTASDNVAVGFQALRNNNGQANVAFGRNALLTQTTASNNTAGGWTAGAALTTGSSNTIFGSTAGSTNTNGSNNCYFGFFAGNLHVGDGSVFIGNNAGSGVGAVSNVLYIANNAGTPIIFGNFSTGDLTFQNKITTGAPAGGAGAIKLGKIGGPVIAVPNANWTLEVDGVTVQIAVNI